MPNRQQRRHIDIFPGTRYPTPEQDLPRRGERRRSPSPIRYHPSWDRPPNDRGRRHHIDLRRPSPPRRPARRTPATEAEAPPPSYRTHAPAHPPPNPRRPHTHTHHDRSPDPTPRPRVPYPHRPDPRFPPRDSPAASLPLTLASPDGFAAHSLRLLPPRSRALATLLATATARFAAHDGSRIRAEDLVETALGTGVLSHVSDGPRGGVWVVEGGREDVVGAVVEMGRGGWEVLGMGCGGSEGRVFLVHACGRGGPDVGVEEEGGERKGKGREVVRGGGTGVVGGRDKGKGKEGEGEGKGRKRDRVMGLVGRIVGKVKKEVEADELVGRIMERVR